MVNLVRAESVKHFSNGKRQGLGGGEKTSFNLSASLNESLLLSAWHRQGSQAEGHHRRIHEIRKGRYAPGMVGKAGG